MLSLGNPPAQLRTFFEQFPEVGEVIETIPPKTLLWAMMHVYNQRAIDSQYSEKQQISYTSLTYLLKYILDRG